MNIQVLYLSLDQWRNMDQWILEYPENWIKIDDSGSPLFDPSDMRVYLSNIISQWFLYRNNRFYHYKNNISDPNSYNPDWSWSHNSIDHEVQ